MLFSLFSALLGFSSLVSAAPAKPVELLAYGPPVISPSADTVWTVGTPQMVLWRTDDIPPEAQTYVVTIYLGHLTNNSENLDLSNPLASSVPISYGEAPITVPDVSPNNTYIVAVVGTSGNTSPPFTIQP